MTMQKKCTSNHKKEKIITPLGSKYNHEEKKQVIHDTHMYTYA